MQRLAQTAEAIAATTKKNEKVQILADYLRSRSVEEAAVSAVFLSGRPFPAWEETTLQVGGRLLWMIVAEISGQPEAELAAAYRRHGDLGSAAYDIMRRAGHARPGIGVLEAAKAFRELASARGTAARAALLRQLLTRATAIEIKYLIKIMTGEMRIGLKESLVEEAIAAAFPSGSAEHVTERARPSSRRARPRVQQVQRANMLLGDIGETLRLAAEDRLDSARMRMFHPIGFMLASPVESAGEAFDYFQHAQVEDKYDGIRAQAHASAGEVRLFSRTLDEVTDSFPELIAPLAAFPEDVILDGEILAWNFRTANSHEQSTGVGRALPFSALQKRLGRKTPTARIMREVPVAYVVFDVLYLGGELVIDKPLRERTALLDELFADLRNRPQASTGHVHTARLRMEDAQGTLQFEPAITADIAETESGRGTAPSPHNPVETNWDGGTNDANGRLSAVIRAPVLRADSAEHLSQLFDLAQARGNEGLMIKDLESAYAPGRRGKSWLKLKRELATLDVVVTAVELGNGKRAGILSDYTFAVRAPGVAPKDELPRTASGDPLLNIGKAYSGLTDAEIAEMHRWFTAHTISDNGWVRQVEPKMVVEVAFNAVMESDRHNSGFALRFPRILRLRPDKTPEEADTLDRVREIFQRQHELPKTA